MEQLHALFDVHLLAPAKTMTARERFDAEFVEAERLAGCFHRPSEARLMIPALPLVLQRRLRPPHPTRPTNKAMNRSRLKIKPRNPRTIRR